AVVLGDDPQLGKRPPLRELRTEAVERLVDTARRDARSVQSCRRAQEHEVLEGEPVFVAGTPMRPQDSGTYVGADVTWREAEESGDVPCREPLHRPVRAGTAAGPARIGPWMAATRGAIPRQIPGISRQRACDRGSASRPGRAAPSRIAPRAWRACGLRASSPLPPWRCSPAAPPRDR